ncbi:hypothetical protein [Roseivivax sediminis]|uniref:Uncharacterized protein n=1 Tax=Roseivivax sediminis TaxID=936889 RepID=A0A1I1UP75_9RHOB|nr:hypothetical protein [Roseivivax sediminis]SFD72596.1 hypothetical protein SAMN04515678_102448 [Roseivivax sediminis]
MPSAPRAPKLLIGEAVDAHTALLRDPTDWPEVDAIDTAGIQLIVSAMKAGIAPPDHVLEAPAVRDLWTSLGLGDTPSSSTR